MEPQAVRINEVEVPLRQRGGVVGGLELAAEGSVLGQGVRWDWSVRNVGPLPERLRRVGLRLDASLERVLEHGWQSWSPVRICRPDDVRPRRRAAPTWTQKMLFAEAEGAGRVVGGDHFLITDQGVVGALTGRRHLTTVEPLTAPGGGLIVWALLDGITIQPGQEFDLDPLWVADGDPGRLYSAYAGHCGDASGARPDARAEPGWSSWYQYFGAPTPDGVRANLHAAAQHGLRVLQIDDGYQRSLGEWLAVKAGWEPMAAVARAVEERGLRPGIWTAPFLVAEGGPVARDHPEWLLRLGNNHPVRAHRSPVGWALALDTTHPGALEFVSSVAATLTAQGFTYHKVDFCYAAALPGRRHDPTVTRAQALIEGLRAVRSGIGSEAFLLACGCPLGPAVGLVDAMRVSTDTGPHWTARPTAVVAGYEESAVGLANALQASLLRAPLHRRLWINDPDCLLLRPSQTELTSWQRELAVDVVRGLGSYLMLSDDLDLYGPDEWARLQRLLRLRSAADTTLEIEDPFSERLVIRSSATSLEVELPLGPGRPRWSFNDPGQ